jgi:hypothetical protein
VIVLRPERSTGARAVSSTPSKRAALSGSAAIAPVTPSVGAPAAVALAPPMLSAKVVPLVSPSRQ